MIQKVYSFFSQRTVLFSVFFEKIDLHCSPSSVTLYSKWLLINFLLFVVCLGIFVSSDRWLYRFKKNVFVFQIFALFSTCTWAQHCSEINTLYMQFSLKHCTYYNSCSFIPNHSFTIDIVFYILYKFKFRWWVVFCVYRLLKNMLKLCIACSGLFQPDHEDFAGHHWKYSPQNTWLVYIVVWYHIIDTCAGQNKWLSSLVQRRCHYETLNKPTTTWSTRVAYLQELGVCQQNAGEIAAKGQWHCAECQSQSGKTWSRNRASLEKFILCDFSF